jgi:peptidoglycan pentaglycine glycine transferase (the first glycine)
MGARYFDLNAITGYFDNNSEFKGLNEMKLGFGSEVNEYIGEFDLVLNKFIYKLYIQI